MTPYGSTTERLVGGDRKLFWVSFVALVGAITVGLVVKQQPLLAIAGVLGALILLCLLKWPDLATLLVIFFMYTNIGPVLIRHNGVPIFLATAFPLILIIPLVWYLFWRGEKLVISPVLLLLLMFAVIYLLGAAFSSDITLAMPQLTEYLVEGLLLYFLLTNVIRTPLMLKRVVWVLLISGALIGGLSLFQQVTKTFSNDYGGFAQLSQDQIGSGTVVENLQGVIQQPRLAGSIGEKN